MTPDDLATATFGKELRGYKPSDVDAFLDDVRRELARLEVATTHAQAEPQVTAAQVANVLFAKEWRGYEMEEVDRFLDQLQADLAQRQSAWAQADPAAFHQVEVPAPEPVHDDVAAAAQAEEAAWAPQPWAPEEPWTPEPWSPEPGGEHGSPEPGAEVVAELAAEQAPEQSAEPDDGHCAFCGRVGVELVVGPEAAICADCVELARQALAQAAHGQAS